MERERKHVIIKVMRERYGKGERERKEESGKKEERTRKS